MLVTAPPAPDDTCAPFDPISHGSSPPSSTDTNHARQVQRLQAVGMLAGGVAHEVSNMMTAVLGFAELALRELGPHHPQHADLTEIIKAAMRASHVTRQLLAFSRQHEAGPQVVDVAVLVEELVPALRQIVGADRRLMVRCPAPAAVAADRARLEQVVINLVANARDATATDGLITIETDIAEGDETIPRHDGQGEAPEGELPDGALPPGPFVRLVVQDNGIGMPDDILARASEPFFTTKAIGNGTGLGLPMVYATVAQSGGFVRIDSAPGQGTTVAVYLPVVEAAPETDDAAPETRHGGGIGSGETVLVVEDEPAVRSLARRILEEQGYQVVDAPNGAAALDSLTIRDGDVALVLTDVVMPRMTGPELAAHLRDRYPEVPVLFMSGYGGAEVEQRGLTRDAAAFVQKPFTSEGLARAVAETLERDGRVRS